MLLLVEASKYIGTRENPYEQRTNSHTRRRGGDRAAVSDSLSQNEDRALNRIEHVYDTKDEACVK